MRIPSPGLLLLLPALGLAGLSRERALAGSRLQLPDPAALGIDLQAAFDRLLSPAGIVNQYALSIVIQIIFITGYTAAGLVYAYVASTTTEPGPALDAVNYLKAHLGTQAVFVTVARGILRLLYELFARTVTTAIMFGVFESVRQILASTTVQSVWSFVSGSTIAEITIVRFILGTFLQTIGFALVTALGPLGDMIIATGRSLAL